VVLGYNRFDWVTLKTGMKLSRFMGRKIEFSISGEPIAQGRPRFSNRGGFVSAYDPAKSRNGKQHVRYAAKHAMEGETPLLGPLHLKAEFGIMMPKSQARKRTPRTREYRTKKPDLDNLLKLVKDGCSGVVYLDDNIVVMITARKIQCAQDEAPFTRLCFEELEPLSDASL
tara:strand:+ start:107 stop:619 length:513 start_codon:yes stop_codon:yes gene_type:complete